VSQPVLLVGGFGLPPQLLAPLARELYGRVVPTGFTVGCGEALTRRVVAAIDASDAPVTLIGHSRGGQLARVAAARRADRVQRLISVGTPSSIGPPQRWGVPMMTALLRRVPNPIALDCAHGACCAEFRRDLAAPVTVPWTAIWSGRDRIVPPHEARHGGADCVQVDVSHVGLVTSSRGRAAIRSAL